MQARNDDLAVLLKLQQIDLEIKRQKKQFDELPQRAQIVEVRKKREVVEGKLEQVAALKKDAKRRLARLEGEDASLAKKEAGTQAAIEAAHGDYRNVQARTKELAGIAKRRATLADERAKIESEINRIDAIDAQAQLACEDLNAAESRAITSFQKEGGALRAQLAQLDQQRTCLARQLDAAVRDAYEKAAARSGGVAVGMLKGNQCGTCRVTFEAGRLVEVKSQAPLATCPSCKRLLIIA